MDFRAHGFAQAQNAQSFKKDCLGAFSGGRPAEKTDLIYKYDDEVQSAF